jgi:hypothetical protein
MFLSRYVLVFQRNILPSSSGLKMVGKRGGGSSYTMKMEAISSSEMFVP